MLIKKKRTQEGTEILSQFSETNFLPELGRVLRSNVENKNLVKSNDRVLTTNVMQIWTDAKERVGSPRRSYLRVSYRLNVFLGIHNHSVINWGVPRKDSKVSSLDHELRTCQSSATSTARGRINELITHWSISIFPPSSRDDVLIFSPFWLVRIDQNKSQ